MLAMAEVEICVQYVDAVRARFSSKGKSILMNMRMDITTIITMSIRMTMVWVRHTRTRLA